jgi:solute carrier family 25 (mitochondrial carnitine/acylcarnitine transporter), member 20/29
VLPSCLQPHVARVVSQHSDISYFHSILTTDIITLLNSSTELTVFLPINSAWDALDPYERLYLESEYATGDLNRILNMHAVIEKKVQYSDSFGTAKNCELYRSATLSLTALIHDK